MGRLDGKVAIITGASGGMGARHAQRFVQEGAKVVLADISVRAGQRLVDGLGEQARFFELDVADGDGWKKIVKFTEAAFGPVTVLVNNAGIGLFNRIEDLSVADYQKTMDVNALSVFLSLKAVIPSMKKAGYGSVVNISSVDGLRGADSATAYCASKFAMNGITRCAAIELADYKIRVNTVHPGIIKTRPSEHDFLAHVIAEMTEDIPMKRPGTMDEVSNLVIFLASDESTYCTGSEFVIDGGMTCDP